MKVQGQRHHARVVVVGNVGETAKRTSSVAGGAQPKRAGGVDVMEPASSTAGSGSLDAGPPPEIAQWPNLYTSQLGAYAQLAQWIDMNLGNRDGVITVAELATFVNQSGHDPRYHQGIIGLAMMLGVPTVQVGNRIALANFNVNVNVTVNNNGGGGGVRYVPQQQPPQQHVQQTQQTRAITVHDVARSLVRMTAGAQRADVDEAIRNLAALPATVLNNLSRRGTKVIVCATVTEYRPDLHNVRPRGWPPGSTWTAPAGMHDPSRNEIVLAHGGTGARVVAHEVGHSLDVARGFTQSNGANFMKFYSADYARLQQARETYLLQPGDAGPSEAFAESHAWFQTNPAWMRAAYPNLHRYWEWVAQNAYVEVGG